MSKSIPWEYRVETFGSTFRQPNDEELETMLDEWGSEGWELVTAHNLESSNKVRLIAKRPLTTTARRRRSWPDV